MHETPSVFAPSITVYPATELTRGRKRYNDADKDNYYNDAAFAPSSAVYAATSLTRGTAVRGEKDHEVGWYARDEKPRAAADAPCVVSA